MFWKGSIVCRLCLLSDSNSEFFEELTEINVNEPESPLALKVHRALNLKVSRDDSLPNHMCHECLQKLDIIIWCDSWSNKIQSYFSKVHSLLESYRHQCDENAKGTLLSIFEGRKANEVFPGLDFSKIRALMSQIEICFAKAEIAMAISASNSSESSSSIRNLSEKCDLNTEIGYIHEKAVNLGMIDKKHESYEALSSLTNSDSETNEDSNSTCLANTDFLKDDTSSKNSSYLLAEAKNRKDFCDKQFACEECNKTFPKKIHLLKHLMSHEGVSQKYQCSLCRKKFISTSELDRHSRAHMGLKPYKCEKCDRYFNQKNLLDNHMNWHEGRKSHLCEICGEYLSSGPNLKTHIQNLHSAVKMKPFKCKICGKCFSRNHHLENHVAIHEKSRPHQCAICGVTFKRSSQLQEHDYVHSGEKKFTCSECHKTFSTKRVLNVHKLVHSEVKPHQCTLCSKSFVRRGGLVAHLKTHST